MEVVRGKICSCCELIRCITDEGREPFKGKVADADCLIIVWFIGSIKW